MKQLFGAEVEDGSHAIMLAKRAILMLDIYLSRTWQKGMFAYATKL